MESINNSQLDNDNWSNCENSFNCSEELSKIRDKLGSIEAENGQLHVEIDNVKTNNNLLLEKNNVLVARLETMEQKLKVAELEAKLAKQEVDKLVAEKVSEMAGQMEQKQRKNMDEIQQKFEEQLQLLRNEMAEKDREVAQVREELGKTAKRLDEVSTDLGAKVGNLENKAADAHNQCKLEKVRKTMEVDERNLTKLGWSNNKWLIFDQEIVRANGLTLTATKAIQNDLGTNVRAQHPVSCALLALMSGLKLVYWEVQMKKSHATRIGWLGRPNVQMNNKWIGDHPGSFAINSLGNYWESGRIFKGYGKGFDEGDVVGSGLLLTRDNRLKMFFTLNGALNGKPIVLKDCQDLLLSPAVSLYLKDASIEANFGADSAGKPFMFDVNVHETELFG